jgi:hypothetical protein
MRKSNVLLPELQRTAPVDQQINAENYTLYRVIHERLPMKISSYATQNTRNPWNSIFCLIRNKLAIQVAW